MDSEPPGEKRTFSLAPDQSRFIDRLVAAGTFASGSDVVREGLRALEEREGRRQATLDALRHSIHEGLDSGPAEPLNMDDIIAEARQRRTSTSAKEG